MIWGIEMELWWRRMSPFAGAAGAEVIPEPWKSRAARVGFSDWARVGIVVGIGGLSSWGLCGLVSHDGFWGLGGRGVGVLLTFCRGSIAWLAL